MQSIQVPNDIESWSDKQVISIPENNLGVEFAKLARANGFDAALGSYGHERRRLDHAVSRFEPPRARRCALIRRPYFNHWRNLGNDRTTRTQTIVLAENRLALSGLLLDCACRRFYLRPRPTLPPSPH